MHRTAVAIATLLLVPALAGCTEAPDNRWALRATQLDVLQRQGFTGQGVRVAVLDSGIDVDHPALRHLTDGDRGNGELAAYVDFLDPLADPRDRGGHGTFLAGVLAAQPASGLPGLLAGRDGELVGLLPEATLLVARVCDREACSLRALWRALDWAIAQRAQVISLSLGFDATQAPQHDLALDGITRALQTAEAHGILVVAAAGNSGARQGVLFPANQPTVLAVAAVDRDGSLRSTSAWGRPGKPDLAAPGQGIVGPNLERGRAQMDGTSAAVPFVVAAGALLIEAGQNPRNAAGVAALRAALRDTTETVPGPGGPGNQALPGVLQAAAALQAYARQSPPAGCWGTASPRPQCP